MGESVGVAFIGAGDVSQWHAVAVAACPMARLVGLCDARPEQAEATAQKYGCRRYGTVDELLADPDVQAVMVLSPVEFHREHVLQALAADKHVLIEKPVANTLGEAQDIEQAARESGRVCMPAHNYIYAPSLRRTKHLVDTGAFGQIVSAWVLYTLHHPREVAAKYPGVLRQIMTHHFYSLLYLLGRPARLVALATETRAPEDKLGREDQVALIAEMPDGALVNLFAGFAADDHTSEPWTVLYKVLGTEGGGLYSWRDAVVLSPGAGLTWRYPAYEESFVHEVDHFVRRCVLNGEEPLSTIEDAVLTQRLIEAAEESIRTMSIINV